MRKSAVITIISTMAFVWTFAYPFRAQAGTKTYTLRFHYEQATTSPAAVYGHEPWAKAVEQATNGRVKVQTFPGDTLFKTKTDAVEAVKAGLTDIAFMYAWAYAPQFDLIDAVSVPFMAPNAEVASRTSWKLYTMFPEIQEQWKDVKLLTVWTTDPYIFVTTKKQIRTLEDFKGMKLRMTGGMATEMMKLLGGTSVTIPMPQNYENLQKGVIDGLASPCEAILGFRFYEVATNYTLVPTTCVSQQLIMNKGSWERLPADIQQQIMSVSGENAAIRYGGSCFDRAWDTLPKEAQKNGYTMNTYTPPQEEVDRWVEQAGKPLWEEWVKNMEKRGYKSAGEIQKTAIGLIQEYKKGKTDTWKELFK
jgi:TRAP-type C4-dicarboxylate transport system substrate-binding protein